MGTTITFQLSPAKILKTMGTESNAASIPTLKSPINSCLPIVGSEWNPLFQIHQRGKASVAPATFKCQLPVKKGIRFTVLGKHTFEMYGIRRLYRNGEFLERQT